MRMFQTAASSFENQVPLELQGALAVSLPALAVSKGLSDVRLWGILETAGPEGTRDYVIAQGVKRGVYLDGEILVEKCTYLTMNGTTWVDVEPVTDADTIVRCEKLAVKALTGDLGYKNILVEPIPVDEEAEAAAAAAAEEAAAAAAAAAAEAGEEAPAAEEPAPPAEGEEEEEAKPTTMEVVVTELTRVAHMVAAIDEDTSVVPKGANVLINTKILPNSSYAGLTIPNDIKSFAHFRSCKRTVPLIETMDFLPELTGDIKGSWSLIYDEVTQQTTLRSLLWPGYKFVHCNKSRTYMALYIGAGNINPDLPFSL